MWPRSSGSAVDDDDVVENAARRDPGRAQRSPISRGKRRVPLPLEKAPRKVTPTAVRVLIVVFGIAVAGIVYLALRPHYDARPITAIETSPDVDGLLVTVTHERCDADEARVSVDESDDVVVVRAEYDTSGGDCDDVEVRTELVLPLDDPLGDRTVRVHEDSWAGSVECLSRGEPAPDVCSGP